MESAASCVTAPFDPETVQQLGSRAPALRKSPGGSSCKNRHQTGALVFDLFRCALPHVRLAYDGKIWFFRGGHVSVAASTAIAKELEDKMSEA